ncbi:MAG: hypothetical protein NTY76_03795 [Candidatus Omnitrophica bacterium]|nr:hypothetical protein [Candidatus Omnitrophota bacterium]
MKECKVFDIAKISAAACLLLFFCASCAKIPLKDGGLVIGKNTTASIEDLGVASLNSKF